MEDPRVHISGKVPLDEETVLLAIEVPRSQIVLIHAIFESYDGLAVVKTIDENKGLICFITTPKLVLLCQQVLESLKESIPWRYYEGTCDLEEIFQYVER